MNFVVTISTRLRCVFLKSPCWSFYCFCLLFYK
nr:MAG TPA: hypothetical protein [Caudoviricetes sp.]